MRFLFLQMLLQGKHLECGGHLHGLCSVGRPPNNMRGGGPAQEKWPCELESKPCLHRVPKAGWGRPWQRSCCLLVTYSRSHCMEGGETLDLSSGLSSPGPVDFGVFVDMPFKGACAQTLSSLRYAVISPRPSQDAAHAV